MLKVGLWLEREELYSRINQRCNEMLQEGLLEEVKNVYAFRTKTALQTVGYTEFFDYLDGKISYEAAVNLFKQHTRNYAKRQITWLKKEEGLKWFAPHEDEKILAWLFQQQQA